MDSQEYGKTEYILSRKPKEYAKVLDLTADEEIHRLFFASQGRRKENIGLSAKRRPASD